MANCNWCDKTEREVMLSKSVFGKAYICSECAEIVLEMARKKKRVPAASAVIEIGIVRII